MRKHLFLGLVLPFILVLSTVGTGFAVWFFGENQDKNNNNNQVQVDNKVNPDFGTIYLQYGNEGDENFISYNDSQNHIDPFLYITQTDVDFPSPVSVKFVFHPKSSYDEYISAYSGFLYSFHYEITISETFNSYFKLVYPTADATETRKASGYLTNDKLGVMKDKEFKLSDPKDDANDSIFEETHNGETSVGFKGVATLPIIINYRSGAIPTSKAAFEAMWTNLEKNSSEKNPLIKLCFYMTVTVKQ